MNDCLAKALKINCKIMQRQGKGFSVVFVVRL